MKEKNGDTEQDEENEGDEENDDDQAERGANRGNENYGEEFYDAFEIFLENGVVPKIKMDERLLKTFNQRGIS